MDRLNEINHLNKNFESIYNKKFSDVGANNRPNTYVNNKNMNAGGNDTSNYNTGKDSLFGTKQVNTKNNNNNINKNNPNKNLTNKSNTANKGAIGRSNSSENNSN